LTCMLAEPRPDRASGGWDWAVELVPHALMQMWLSPLAGLVVTAGLLKDDIDAVCKC
jgi:hypothetical protein